MEDRDVTQGELTLQRQIERERLIVAIARRLRQDLDLDTILKTTVTEVRQFLQCDRVVLYQFEPNWSGRVVVESVDPRWRPLLNQLIHDPCFGAAQALAYRYGRVSVIENVESGTVKPCHAELLRQFQVQANLVVPILQGQILWGLLIAHQCDAPRVWEPIEVDLLKELAEQVGIAIKHAELFQQVNHLAASLEQQVQERTAQLQMALNFQQMLQRITTKIRESLDEDRILQTVVQELGQVLALDCCDVAMFNADQTELTICYEYAPGSPSAQNRTIKKADLGDLYSQLLQGQILQFCPLDLEGKRPIPIRAAMLACPIADETKILGDLWLYQRDTDGFSEVKVQLVHQVANQCAIALRQSRLHQAAQAQVHELERLDRLKDDFLSRVSHELRSPIANIKMSAEVLAMFMVNGSLTPEKAERYLKILNDECDREMNLINDLLDLTRLEAGNCQTAWTPIRLQDWIPHVVEPFHLRTQQNQQRLQLNLSPNLPDLVSDLASLGRILTELLNNACKYTPAGETITVAVSQQVDEVQLSVSNEGTEIPPEELPRIFDKFYRIPSSDRWQHGGTGLGLTLVKGLAEHLGGRIWASSTKNTTTFTLALPLCAPAAVSVSPLLPL
ncbi:GAF domain-containing protein [Trichothermofontia sp.]